MLRCTGPLCGWTVGRVRAVPELGYGGAAPPAAAAAAAVSPRRKDQQAVAEMRDLAGRVRAWPTLTLEAQGGVTERLRQEVLARPKLTCDLEGATALQKALVPLARRVRPERGRAPPPDHWPTLQEVRQVAQKVAATAVAWEVDGGLVAASLKVASILSGDVDKELWHGIRRLFNYRAFTRYCKVGAQQEIVTVALTLPALAAPHHAVAVAVWLERRAAVLPSINQLCPDLPACLAIAKLLARAAGPTGGRPAETVKAVVLKVAGGYVKRAEAAVADHARAEQAAYGACSVVRHAVAAGEPAWECTPLAARTFLLLARLAAATDRRALARVVEGVDTKHSRAQHIAMLVHAVSKLRTFEAAGGGCAMGMCLAAFGGALSEACDARDVALVAYGCAGHATTRALVRPMLAAWPWEAAFAAAPQDLQVRLLHSAVRAEARVAAADREQQHRGGAGGAPPPAPDEGAPILPFLSDAAASADVVDFLAAPSFRVPVEEEAAAKEEVQGSTDRAAPPPPPRPAPGPPRPTPFLVEVVAALTRVPPAAFPAQLLRRVLRAVCVVEGPRAPESRRVPDAYLVSALEDLLAREAAGDAAADPEWATLLADLPEGHVVAPGAASAAARAARDAPPEAAALVFLASAGLRAAPPVRKWMAARVLDAYEDAPPPPSLVPHLAEAAAADDVGDPTLFHRILDELAVLPGRGARDATALLCDAAFACPACLPGLTRHLVHAELATTTATPEVLFYLSASPPS